MPGTTPVYALRYQVGTDAPNGAQGLQNLAEDVEAQLVLVNAKIPACKLYNSAQQVIGSGVGQVQCQYDTTIIDTLSATTPMADLVNDKITIKKAGIYLLRSNVLWLAGTAAGILRLDMAINGVTNNSTFTNGTAQATSMEVVTHAVMAVNDTITSFVQQTTGANRTLDDNTYQNVFNLEAIWLGPAV